MAATRVESNDELDNLSTLNKRATVEDSNFSDPSSPSEGDTSSKLNDISNVKSFETFGTDTDVFLDNIPRHLFESRLGDGTDDQDKVEDPMWPGYAEAGAMNILDEVDSEDDTKYKPGIPSDYSRVHRTRNAMYQSPMSGSSGAAHSRDYQSWSRLRHSAHSHRTSSFRSFVTARSSSQHSVRSDWSEDDWHDFDDVTPKQRSDTSDQQYTRTPESDIRYADQLDKMVADNQLGVTEQSEWLDHLRNLDLLPDPWNEMNWSGRGQHVEFLPHEAKEIPLKTEKVLGYTYSAIVESVRCKRIRLARKTIRCSRAFKREDAIREVEHLQKLHHSHIIRVVGSYILKKDLSILLYPVAEYTLNTFIEEMCEQPHFWPGSKSTEMRESLRQFFTCLLHAVSYLHKQAIKHMDIKPKNLLIRDVRNSRYRGVTNYKVYLADFGIARSYRSEAEAETSGPTSFTRIYSAPEVVAQDTRGLKADIFSLGAVFTEMLAVTWQPYPVQQRQHLIDIRGCNSDYDKSFQANILPIQDWLSSLSTPRMSEPERTIASIAIKMLHYEPSSRPQADALLKMRCFSNSGTCCIERTEEFEIAKDTL